MNIASEYISFSQDSIKKYLMLILDHYFDQNIYDDMINAYINTRYYNLYPSVYNYLNNASDSASGAFDAAVYFCNVYEGAATSAGRGELAYTYYESGQ